MNPAAVVILFGVGCLDPCPIKPIERERLEALVHGALASRGHSVRPPAKGVLRPVGPDALGEPYDVAEALGADRVLVLDLEPNGKQLWLTHFVSGVIGAWSIGRVMCARTKTSLECPDLEKVVVGGLRPRRSEDIDFTSALRVQASRVGACVMAEEQADIDERIFGRVELGLQVLPSGQVRLASFIPKRIGRADLGRCLKAAMESMHVGPFEGEVVEFRVPLDLD